MVKSRATAVFRVLASPMSRAEVTGHVIFPNMRTNIAESGKFFYEFSI